MQTQNFAIPTPDALKILGENLTTFRGSIDKKFYTCAPISVDGKRTWDLDALAVRAWYQSLHKVGMKRPMGGALAGLLKAAIEADPKADCFRVFAWEDGNIGRMWIGLHPPREAPNAVVIMDVPIAEWRTKIRAAVDDFYRRKAAAKKG